MTTEPKASLGGDEPKANAPGITVNLVKGKVYGDLAIRHWINHGLKEGEYRLYAHPAGAEAPSVVGALDGLTPEETERLEWIEAELADEPNRPIYGNGAVPPCRNGHEITELEHEALTLKLKSAEHRLAALAALSPQALGEPKAPDAAEVVVACTCPEPGARRTKLCPKCGSVTKAFADAAMISTAEQEGRA